MRLCAGPTPAVLADLHDVEATLLTLFLKATQLEITTGYTERAIAVFQALLEYNICRPPHVSAHRLRQLFQAFWDSEVPRIGMAAIAASAGIYLIHFAHLFCVRDSIPFGTLSLSSIYRREGCDSGELNAVGWASWYEAMQNVNAATLDSLVHMTPSIPTASLASNTISKTDNAPAHIPPDNLDCFYLQRWLAQEEQLTTSCFYPLRGGTFVYTPPVRPRAEIATATTDAVPRLSTAVEASVSASSLSVDGTLLNEGELAAYSEEDEHDDFNEEDEEEEEEEEEEEAFMDQADNEDDQVVAGSEVVTDDALDRVVLWEDVEGWIFDVEHPALQRTLVLHFLQLLGTRCFGAFTLHGRDHHIVLCAFVHGRRST
jgi:hypothetical protein